MTEPDEINYSRLDSRVALVTGAARGIGLATARILVASGANVVLVDLDAAELATAVETLPADQVEALAIDLLADDGPQRTVDAAIARWGQLDIVINNAGYAWDAPVHTMTDEQWDAMLDIHASVPFRILRAAAPHLREPAKSEIAAGVKRHRKVVNVTSVSGTAGNATQANYAAAKAALVGLTKSLAKEWGPLRINVNAVALGFIDTRLNAPRDEANVVRIGGSDVQLGVPDQNRAMVEMFTPLGRAGTADDAAGPIWFLCSPLSDYMTGQVLTVSGGLPIGMS